MRRLHPANLQVATRGTSREINSQIVVNLVRTLQPLSRADLARRMGLRRGAVTLIVNDLLKRKVIVEGATGHAVRGRRPTSLYIDSRRRVVVAADIRASETFLMLADLVGKPLTGVASHPTLRNPKQCVPALAGHVKALLTERGEGAVCEGIGVVVPGMVEHSSMRVLHAPTLGWRDVDLREPLAAATGLPVQIENSGRACALAQIWGHRHDAAPGSVVVFVSVSDGVGVGVIVDGDVLRGRHNIAGEFGHVPLSLDGPRCSCGSNGCWEAYVSNRATLARYFGWPSAQAGPVDARQASCTVEDVITRARSGDAKAVAAVEATARYLGLGLASVVNALDPTRVYVGGEITLAWDLVEQTVRAALAERALTPAAATAEIVPVAASEHPRLRGAAALVTAPALLVPVVA